MRIVPAAQNPFLPGQPITDDICNSQDGMTLQPTFTLNNQNVTGQPAINLAVACGNDPDLFRMNYQGLGSIQRVEAEANSNYKALQFSLLTRLSQLRELRQSSRKPTPARTTINAIF